MVEGVRVLFKYGLMCFLGLLSVFWVLFFLWDLKYVWSGFVLEVLVDGIRFVVWDFIEVCESFWVAVGKIVSIPVLILILIKFDYFWNY